MKPQPTLAIEAMTVRNPLTLGHELAGTGALREAIGRQVARLCFQMHGESLRAVVLTGSLARDEATLVEERNSWRLLGDAEFLLIFQPRASLPPKVAMGFLRQNIETSISRLGIAGEISISVAHAKYLRSLRPHIFAYELKNCGQVVGGDSEILTQIPCFSATDIPLEDGWRLLSNRMVEQLEVLEDLEQRPKLLPPRLHYSTVKLYLDMATSFLLFAGQYAPTYEERAQRLRMLADTQPADDKAPFNLRQFCDRVSECTQWKLSEIDCDTSSISQPPGERDSTWWEEAVGYAQALWGWELALLTGSTGEVGNQELLKRWMNCQPVYRHFPGWLHVLRNQGWHRSWRNWPRWSRLAWRAAPRYWVYGAASEVFAQLPGLPEKAGTGRTDTDWERLRAFLPVIPGSEKQAHLLGWGTLAKEIAWNYRTFLAETVS
jgi:hypothetical protein